MVAIVLERWLDMIMRSSCSLIGMVYDLPNGVVVEGIDVLAAGQRILERWLALVLSDYLDSLLLGNLT